MTWMTGGLVWAWARAWTGACSVDRRRGVRMVVRRAYTTPYVICPTLHNSNSLLLWYVCTYLRCRRRRADRGLAGCVAER